jgi:hypothetical protein
MAYIESKFMAAQHPDVKSGKRTEKEVKQEFVETFEQHHKVVNPQSDMVTPEEFLDYCSHVSANIDSDAFFELMMSNAWNLTGQDSMPFAGSQRKITNVNAREAYRNDHHRNLFGTDTKTPFGKKTMSEWQTS